MVNVTKLVLSGVCGMIVAVVLGMVTLPLVAIAGGAITAFVVTRRYTIQRHYDSVGTIYYLSLGGLVYALPFVPNEFKQTPMIFLLVFGVLSGLIILAKRTLGYLIGLVAGRVGRTDRVSPFWNAISSIVGTAILAWSVVKLKYRLAKTGIVGVATPLGLAVNIIGHLIELPWILETGIDITAVVFIGGVIVGFHALTSWYEVLALRHDPLIQAFAERSKDTASMAASKSKDATAAASERSKTIAMDTASKTTQEARERSEQVARSDVLGSGLMSRVLGLESATARGES